jgi:hypothetical protein
LLYTEVHMNTSEHILVIVLAAMLALFLLLSVVIAIQIVRLLHKIQLIAQKAESVIESAESVGTVFKNAAGPMALVRVIRNMIHVAQDSNKRSK